jgi:hypothetical protein
MTRSGRPAPTKASFVQIEGRWKFEQNRAATFVAPTADIAHPAGLCLLPLPFRSGVISAKVRFIDSVEEKNGQIVVGYNPATGAYLSAGLGGYGAAYVINSFAPGQGWRPVARRGSISQISADQTYDVRVDVVGQQMSLSIDQVQVLEIDLTQPFQGSQCGLFAWGPTGGVEFSDFEIDGDEPRVFVVMQFGSPYDDLYREVIERISKKLGLATLRGDDVFANSSSIILQDIIRNIKESDIIIAEITPVNANVFYELGYAHAMNKPTILLANRTVEKLPFDVSGYRVIFYDDTIRGRRDIEENLEKHLENVVKGFGAVRRGSPTMAN